MYELADLVKLIRKRLGSWERRYDDFEIQCYLEMSIEWMNCLIEEEFEPPYPQFYVASPGVYEAFVVCPYEEEDGEKEWLEAILWGAVQHAALAVAMNSDDADEIEAFDSFKETAAAAMDRALEAFGIEGDDGDEPPDDDGESMPWPEVQAA